MSLQVPQSPEISLQVQPQPQAPPSNSNRLPIPPSHGGHSRTSSFSVVSSASNSKDSSPRLQPFHHRGLTTIGTKLDPSTTAATTPAETQANRSRRRASMERPLETTNLATSTASSHQANQHHHHKHRNNNEHHYRQSPHQPTQAFIRARARWHQALSAIISKASGGVGSAALAHKQSFIHSNYLLSRLAREKQYTLQNLLRKVVFKKGTVIYRQGDYPFLVYFILSGTVQVETNVIVPPKEQPVVTMNEHKEASAEPALPYSKTSNEKHRRSTDEGPLIDTHVQRVLDGWFKDSNTRHSSSPNDLPSAPTLHVPLFHLTAPDIIGEKEALVKVALRDSTVTALTEVTAYVLRRLSFRQITRGRVQTVLERSIMLKSCVVKERIQLALRMHYEKKVSFMAVHSRLDLTPFAGRALKRMQQMKTLKIQLDQQQQQLQQAEEKQSDSMPTSARVNRSSSNLQPSPPSSKPSSKPPLSARPTTSASKSIPLLAADGSVIPPSTVLPSKSASELAAHHVGILHAQAALECARAQQIQQRLRRKQQQQAVKEKGDQYKYGFVREKHKKKHKAAAKQPELRKGGRKVLNSHGEFVYVHELHSSESESDSAESDDSDTVAATVWNSFPHAYSQAQWSVYHQERRPINPYQQEGEDDVTVSAHEAIIQAQQATIEQELYKTDFKNAHLTISTPHKGARPTSAPMHKRTVSTFLKRNQSVRPRPPPTLPLSASFVGIKDEPPVEPSTTIQLNPFTTKNSQTTPKSSSGKSVELNTRLYQPAPPPTPPMRPSTASTPSRPILAADPMAPPPPPSAKSHLSFIPKTAHTPLLSFFSADLLRHLETHYLRSTEVDPISYTGKWMFFHAPHLPDQMPSRRRIRKPPNWRPFTLPDERGSHRLEDRLQDALTQSPLDVGGAYFPPPPPFTSMLGAPRQGEVIPVVEVGGQANTEEHWRHLQTPTRPTSAIGQHLSPTASRPASRMGGVNSPNYERHQSPIPSSPPSAHHRSPSSHPHHHRSPSHLRQPSSLNAVTAQEMEELVLASNQIVPAFGPPLTARPTSAQGHHHLSYEPLAASSNRALSPDASPSRSRPHSARPQSASTMRRTHRHRPSMELLSKAYTFRVGYADGEREVVSPTLKTKDWQFDQLKRGRLDVSSSNRPSTTDLHQIIAEGNEDAILEALNIKLPGSARSARRVSLVQSKSNPSSKRSSRRATQVPTDPAITIAVSGTTNPPFLQVQGQPVVSSSQTATTPPPESTLTVPRASVRPQSAPSRRRAQTSVDFTQQLQASNFKLNQSTMEMTSHPEVARDDQEEEEKDDLFESPITQPPQSSRVDQVEQTNSPVPSSTAAKEVVKNESNRPRPATATERQQVDALLASFDPRRVEVRTIRKSLADHCATTATPSAVTAAGPPASSQHPYLPKHAGAVSLSASQSHAYVYGARNQHASEAIRSLSAFRHQQAPPGSVTPRGIGTAEARAHSLYLQLQPFTQVKNQPVAVARIHTQRFLEREFGTDQVSR